jgi:hypothetical protein
MAWPRFGFNLSAMQGDGVHNTWLKVAIALHERTDELAALLAVTTRRSRSSPLVFRVGAEVLPQIACTPPCSVDVYSA